MKIKQNNFSYSINSDEPADVLFQDITENDTFFSADNFKQVCYLVPFCDSPDWVRASSKVYRRHYGTDKMTVVDLDETFPAYKSIMSDGQEYSSEALVSHLLKSWGHLPPKESGR